jgi:uncharacterized protein with HEPN domain
MISDHLPANSTERYHSLATCWIEQVGAHASNPWLRAHLQRGGLSDGLVFDAVRIRLLEIGEAVKALPAELLDTQPAIPWRQVARMRDHLAHRYFDTDHAVLQATVDDDLPELERAVQTMTAALPEDPPLAWHPGREQAPTRRPAVAYR